MARNCNIIFGEIFVLGYCNIIFVWYNYNAIDKEAGCFSAGKGIEIMTKFGTLEFKEFNFRYWIEIRKGSAFYKGYILDEKKNVIYYTHFFYEFDNCLNYTREMLDDIMNGIHHEFKNPMG